MTKDPADQSGSPSPRERRGPNLREILPGYFPPDRSERQAMLAEGLVCVDTNVLLDLYRFTPNARADLVHVLERLGDRLFVPYQVALEFQRRRFDAIRSQQSFFEEKISALEKDMRSVESMTSALIKGVGATDEFLTAASESAIDALRKMADHVRAMQADQDISIPTDHNHEPIQDLVVNLLDGRTGQRPATEDVAAWHREADERFAKKIPPGFADAEKRENSHGDYLLWRELLDEAGRRGLPVTLVSREEKPDWVLRYGARIVGPLPHLVEEMHETAGVRFTLMTPTAFLEEARTALSVTVDDSTVSQARERREVDHLSSDDAFSGWLLAHPEVLGVTVGRGGTWRNADLESLLGPELLQQLEPFRSVGRTLPKTVLRAALEAKMLAARLERLRATEVNPDQLIDASDDERLLADLQADEIAEVEARLREIMAAVPGLDPFRGGSEPH